jgi:tyrosyl-tRNA synthetase
MDASMLIYPAMQVADIFHLNVDVAIGGLDQRKAHMLARDVSEKLDWNKVIAVHTPLLSGLQGGGRMDSMEAKMSKSNPESSIFIHDSPEEIVRKIRKAYCPQGEIGGNPIIEICRFILFNRFESIDIKRPEKYGGNLVINNYEELEDVFGSDQLHPQDLKDSTADYLTKILDPVQSYFSDHPENYCMVKDIDVTR